MGTRTNPTSHKTYHMYIHLFRGENTTNSLLGATQWTFHIQYVTKCHASTYFAPCKKVLTGSFYHDIRLPEARVDQYAFDTFNTSHKRRKRDPVKTVNQEKSTGSSQVSPNTKWCSEWRCQDVSVFCELIFWHNASSPSLWVKREAVMLQQAG